MISDIYNLTVYKRSKHFGNYSRCGAAEPLAVFKLCSVAGVTILLSLTVFLNLVAETLPQVSDAIPLLGTNRFMSDLPVLTTLPSVLPDFELCVSLCICDCLYPRANLFLF